jgi:hypothetical protein
MTALGPLAIRLFCDLAARNSNSNPVTDLNTGQPAFFYRGDDVEVDIGIGQGGALLAPTLTNITSVTAQIFAKENDTGAPMMSCTVAAANMNAGLTAAQWTGNTAPFYHAAFVFPNAQTYITLNGASSQSYWLRITLTTGDGTPKTLTLLDGPITVLDGPVNATPAAGWGNARFWTDGSGNLVLQIKNDSDGKFCTVGVENGAGGLPGIYLGDVGY